MKLTVLQILLLFLVLSNIAMIQLCAAENQQNEIQKSDSNVVEKIEILAESMDTYPLRLLEDPINYWQKHSNFWWDPVGMNQKRYHTYQEFLEIALSADRQDCEIIIDSLKSSSPKVRALLLIILYFQVERKYLSIIGRYLEDDSIAFFAIDDYQSDMKLCWEDVKKGKSALSGPQAYYNRMTSGINIYSNGQHSFYTEKKVGDVATAILWAWNYNRKLTRETQKLPISEFRKLDDGRDPVILLFSDFYKELTIAPKSYIDYQVCYLLRGFDVEKREYALDFLMQLKKEIQESGLTQLQKAVMTFAAFYEFEFEKAEKELIDSLNRELVLELLTRKDLNSVDSILFTEYPSPYISTNIPIRDNKELAERIYSLIRKNYFRYFIFEEIQSLVPEMTPYPKRLFTNENWIKNQTAVSGTEYISIMERED